MCHRVPRVALGVANDPWDKTPRLEISHINGTEVKNDAPLPANIKDAKQGNVLLSTGDFAILHLQFRVGDGDTISKDWEALGALEALFLPWAPFHITSTSTALPAALPTAQAPASGAEGSGLLRAPFDQRGVRAHYADFIEHGEEAYMRSHFGDAGGGGGGMSRAEGMIAAMGEMLLGQGAQAGNADVLVQRLRDAGMGELADKLGSR